MIDYETYCLIRDLARKGLTFSQIASETGRDQRTIRYWLDQPRYRRRSGGKRTSKLDPYKGLIAGWLERHPYTAVQILQRLRRDYGYTGGYTIVKEYVSHVRPGRNRAYLALAYEPGECIQVDWGSWGSIAVGSTRRRLSFLVMVCCYSRLLYLEFTPSEKLEQFLQCLRNGLEFFGGCTRGLLFDNLKTAILKHRPGESPRVHPRMLEMAAHYGFEVKAHPPRKAHQKGRVENAVGYVKKNLLGGLEIHTLESLNAAGAEWRDTIANVREHRETRKRPVDLFAEEKAHLLPLPPKPYDTAIVESVRASSQFRVSVDGNRYTVPCAYASKRLELWRYAERICFYRDGEQVARHPRCYDRGRTIEDPDHAKPLLEKRKRAGRQQKLQSFLDLTPKAEAYYRGLKERRVNAFPHVSKILALREIYGTEKVVRAIEEGLHLGAFSSEYLLNMLEQWQRPRAESAPLHLTRRQDLLELEIPERDLSEYESRHL